MEICLSMSCMKADSEPTGSCKGTHHKCAFFKTPGFQQGLLPCAAEVFPGHQSPPPLAYLYQPVPADCAGAAWGGRLAGSCHGSCLAGHPAYHEAHRQELQVNAKDMNRQSDIWLIDTLAKVAPFDDRREDGSKCISSHILFLDVWHRQQLRQHCAASTAATLDVLDVAVHLARVDLEVSRSTQRLCSLFPL